MRILLLTASYKPVLGGLQTVTAQLARGLQERGHEVLVVTNRYPRSLPQRDRIDGVPIYRWLFLWPKRAYWQQRRPDLGLAGLFYGPSTWQRLRRLLADWQPEVINMHFPDAQIPFFLRERRNYNGRLVVSLHGDEIERFDSPQSRSGANDLRTLLKSAQAVTACSSYLLEMAAGIEPDIRSKSEVIYNGFDPLKFEDAEPYKHVRPYFLAYGRFTYKKGFDMLLRAWAETHKDYPTYDLLLAGDGELKNSLQQQAFALGITDRVRFWGRATPDEVASLLAGSVFVVVPSRLEPFGIVALETLAADRRILATDVGGLPELLMQAAPPMAYELVAPTVDGLAIGLRKMMARPTVKVAINLNDFVWECVVDLYEQILQGN